MERGEGVLLGSNRNVIAIPGLAHGVSVFYNRLSPPPVFLTQHNEFLNVFLDLMFYQKINTVTIKKHENFRFMF